MVLRLVVCYDFIDWSKQVKIMIFSCLDLGDLKFGGNERAMHAKRLPVVSFGLFGIHS